MNRLVLTTALAAFTLAGTAAAKDHGHGHDKHDKHSKHYVVRDHDRDDDRDDWREDNRHEGRHDNGRHLGQLKHRWARGQQLPRVYLVPQYYVREYRTYELAPPPPGAVWVRPYPQSRDFYLVQMATGIISQVLGR